MSDPNEQQMHAQPAQSDGGRWWRFNPRFYRPSQKPRAFPELYWVFGFEFLAMLALGLAVYFFSIKPRLAQRGKEMDVYQRLKSQRVLSNQPEPAISGTPDPSGKP
ncbi:MAG: hypothetical protein ACKOS8_13200 [Gemmataceae bacterium]